VLRKTQQAMAATRGASCACRCSTQKRCGTHAHPGAASADSNARRAAVRDFLPRPHSLPQPGGAGGIRGVRGLPRLPGGPEQPATAHVHCSHGCRRALPQSTCSAPGRGQLPHTARMAPSRKLVLPGHAAPVPSCDQCCTAHTLAGMSSHHALCSTALLMRPISALLHQTEASTCTGCAGTPDAPTGVPAADGAMTAGCSWHAQASPTRRSRLCRA